MYYKEPERSPYSTAPNVIDLASENSLESQVSSSRERVGTPLQKRIMINNKQVFIIGNGESRIGFDLEKLRYYGKIYGCNMLYEEFTPDALVAVDERIMHPCYWSGYPIENVCWFRDWRPMPGDAYDLLTDSSIISEDPNIDMSDYLFTNSRNDSTEFVVHGTHRDRAEEYEKELRDKDKNNVLDESAYELVFKAGLYTTWINSKGDRVQSMGQGSFPPQYQESQPEVYQKFKQQGSIGVAGVLAMNCGPTAQLIASLVEQPIAIYFIGFDMYSHNDRINNVYKGKYGYMAETGNVVPPDAFIHQHRDMFNLFPNIKHYKVNEKPLGSDVVNREVPEWKGISNLEYLTYAELFGRLASGRDN